MLQTTQSQPYLLRCSQLAITLRQKTPLVIASYNINSQLLALGNSFSLGFSLSLCPSLQQSQQLPSLSSPDVPFYSYPHIYESHVPCNTTQFAGNNALPHRHAQITIIIFTPRVAATYHAILLVLHRYDQNGFKSVAALRKVKCDHVSELIHN